jgi:hypothetical protein
MTTLFIRNGHVFDSYTESGAEGIDPEDLPGDMPELLDLNAPTAEQFVIDAVSRDPTSDRVRWPRHFYGPSVGAAIVRARMRLADRGLIMFDGHYWKLAIQA